MGWPALLLDAACGAAAFVAIIGPTSAIAAAVTIGVTGLMVALARLYRAEWQPTWPLRLALAVAAATVWTALVLPVVASHATPSPGSIATHAAATFLLGLSWRIADGFRHRWAERRARGGSAEAGVFVEKADELASMSSGALHVWRYRHLLRNLVGKHLLLKYRGSMRRARERPGQ